MRKAIVRLAKEIRKTSPKTINTSPASEIWSLSTIPHGQGFEAMSEKSFQVQARTEPAHKPAKLLLGQTGSWAHPTEPGGIQVKLGAHKYTES